MDNIIDIWEDISPEEFVISEAESEVDGKHILARVVGPAFFPDTTSGNKVTYPKAAWNNALQDKDFNSRLNDRLVFGTIGHDPVLDDNDIRKGNFSHIVTKAWIDEDNKGKAEYLVLNTPPGQILNTILRAKSKIKVSTKAKGKLESADKISGTKKVDPKTFKLERIDFVINPGYKQAEPSLVENLDNQAITEELEMDDKIMSILEAQIKELTEGKKITDAQAAKFQSELRVLSEAQARSRTIIENYEQIGTLAEITEMAKALAAYKSIGEVSEVKEAIEGGETALSQLVEHVKVLKARLEAADAAKSNGDDDDDVKDPDDESVSLGSKKEIKEALQRAKKFIAEATAIQESLGTPEEIKTALESLKEYIELGSVSDIRGVFTEAEKLVKEAQDKAIKELAAKHECDEDAVRSMASSGMDPDSIDKVLTSVKGTSETKKKKRTNESLSTTSIRNKSVTVSVEENRRTGGNVESLAARLMSQRK